MKTSKEHEILAPVASSIPGIIAITLGAVIGVAGAALTVASLMDSGVEEPHVSSMLLATLGLAMVVMGVLVRTPKGGVKVIDDTLLLGGSIPGEALALPVAHLEGVWLYPRDERVGKEERRLWTVDVRDTSGVLYAVAESVNRTVTDNLSQALASVLGVAFHDAAARPALSDDPSADGEGGSVRPLDDPRVDTKGPWIGRVGVGWAQEAPFVSFALVAFLLGGLLYSLIDVYPVVGFMVGAFALVLGAILFGLEVIKVAAHEHLSTKDGTMVHKLSLGPLSWAKESTEIAKVTGLRINIRGTKGASLELFRDRYTVVMWAGVTGRTVTDLTALTAIARGVARRVGSESAAV